MAQALRGRSAGRNKPAGLREAVHPSISLLGPQRIDGTRRPPKRVKTRELIAYLALHPHGASREEITEAIWPGQDPKKTRPRLWESASDAKRALGDAWVVEGDQYRLDRGKLNIGSAAFVQLLRPELGDWLDQQRLGNGAQVV